MQGESKTLVPLPCEAGGLRGFGRSLFSDMLSLCFLALAEIPLCLVHVWKELSPAQGAGNPCQAEGTGGGHAVAVAASEV